MDRGKPAYCLRKEDFKPFVGPGNHEERSILGRAVEEKITGIYCGPSSVYAARAEARTAFLRLYNIVIVGIHLMGGAVGLAKLLFK